MISSSLLKHTCELAKPNGILGVTIVLAVVPVSGKYLPGEGELPTLANDRWSWPRERYARSPFLEPLSNLPKDVQASYGLIGNLSPTPHGRKPTVQPTVTPSRERTTSTQPTSLRIATQEQVRNRWEDAVWYAVKNSTLLFAVCIQSNEIRTSEMAQYRWDLRRPMSSRQDPRSAHRDTAVRFALFPQR